MIWPLFAAGKGQNDLSLPKSVVNCYEGGGGGGVLSWIFFCSICHRSAQKVSILLAMDMCMHAPQTD